MDKQLQLSHFNEQHLTDLARQIGAADSANDATTGRLAEQTLNAIARSEAAALEAKILARFLTDM